MEFREALICEVEFDNGECHYLIELPKAVIAVALSDNRQSFPLSLLGKDYQVSETFPAISNQNLHARISRATWAFVLKEEA